MTSVPWIVMLLPVFEYAIAIYLAYRLIGFRPDFPVWRGIWMWFAVMLGLLGYARTSATILPADIAEWHRFVASQCVGLVAIRMVWIARHIFPDRRAAPVPVAQVQMDWRGIIVDWNRAATKLLGWTPEEAIGQELATLLIPEDLTVPTPEGPMNARERHRAGLQVYRDTGRAAIINTRFTTMTLRKSDSPLAVDVYITAHITDQGTRFLGAVTPAPFTKG